MVLLSKVQTQERIGHPLDAWREAQFVQVVAGEFDGVTGTFTSDTRLAAMPFDVRIALGEAIVKAFDLRQIDEIALPAGAAWVEGLTVL